MTAKQPKQIGPLTDDSLTCPLCDSAGVTTTIEPHFFNYGSGELKAEISVDAHVRRCSSCDFDYLDHETENLKQAAICQHLGVLSPDEIRSARRACGMSRRKFAQVTGLDEASIHRWENGLNIQLPAYDRYLRLLAIPGVIGMLENVVNETSDPVINRD